MALFSKGKGGDSFKRDPRKARRFFEHAQVVSEARNYDYAIECYINGLRHDPDNMSKHEALRDVSLKRKVGGGKPAGLGAKFKSIGSSAVDKMLQAEKLWAMDPLNVKHMRDMMRYAVEAEELDQASDDEEGPDSDGDGTNGSNMAEVAYWVGAMVLESNASAKRPDKSLYLKTRDLFARISAFDKAVEACRRALALDPTNSDLQGDLKNLEAERTMQEGGYSDKKSAEEGGFRQFVRDEDKQRQLDQEGRIRKSGTAAEEIIASRRAEWEEDPQDMARLVKLVDALLKRETPESEKEAVELLNQAAEQTGQYRFKTRVGDIRMKQFNRLLRQLRTKREESPGDEQVTQKYEEAKKKQLEFELREFADRVQNYPTDMGMRYELGKRLLLSRQVDEAIGAFQQAKADAKHRASAHLYLGHCYVQKQWFEEAIDTLRQGVEGHALSDDRTAMELRYLLMDSLFQSGVKEGSVELAKEAREIGSQILQTDINFRDIKTRMDEIRKLVEDLI